MRFAGRDNVLHGALRAGLHTASLATLVERNPLATEVIGGYRRGAARTLRYSLR